MKDPGGCGMESGCWLLIRYTHTEKIFFSFPTLSALCFPLEVHIKGKKINFLHTEVQNLQVFL